MNSGIAVAAPGRLQPVDHLAGRKQGSRLAVSASSRDQYVAMLRYPLAVNGRDSRGLFGNLRALIGDDKQLRRSVMEALLWLPTGRAADLSQLAAVAIADADDRDFLLDLEQHCVRLVRCGAHAVRAAPH